VSRRPDFVIIGAQKAASTLLMHTIRRHPDAWTPEIEQFYFRDPVYDWIDAKEFLAAYAERPERRLGLKCPDYLGRPEVPARLAADLDVPDLIVCLRDPVSRALSSYFWKMRWGIIPVMPAEEGLRRILDGELRDVDKSVGDVLGWGLYGEHLTRYLEHFPREKLLVLMDDELRRAPADTIDRITGFLGIGGLEPDAPSRRARNEGVYPLPRMRFLQKRSTVLLHWDADRTFHSVLPPTRPDHRLFSLAVAGIDHYVLSRVYGNARPQLSAELTTALHDYYRDDVRALESLLGLDTGWIATAQA
jgi:hypothetical protein